MKKILLAACFIFSVCATFAQHIERMYPPNWWVGMKDSSLQLLLYGKNIAAWDMQINYPGVQLYAVSKVENPDYLFADIIISDDAKPGEVQLQFSNKKEKFTQTFSLQARQQRKMQYGLNSSDLIYLIMPDRFSNGDVANDSVPGMQEKYYGRNKLTARHGGDLQGIMDHLDYIKNIGVTAIWCTPLLENDQPEWSYHGYAATDLYKIDRRFGTNALYQQYAAACHAKDLKVVMDIVPNHVGSQSWFVLNSPMHGWLHEWDTYTKTNYRTPALVDNYGSNYDRKIMQDGWFDKNMPDLNQQNPFVANYLIQNYIWWIEYAQLDGFRIDTYTYNDLDFMTHMQQRVFKEYPGFGMFGEVWVDGLGIISYFKGDNALETNYNSTLPGVTDFELLWSINNMVEKPFGWTDGVGSIYLKLTQDFLYGDANKNVVFLGNHDLSRFYSVCGENFDKMKLATTFLLTTRGIPQWYYGDEILMKNFREPSDALVREDFPGGWKSDSINKFNIDNLQGKEREFFAYFTKLANYRKTSAPITEGKLMQFVPYDGVYVYFRYTDTQTVMVVMNTSDKAISLDTKNYAERLQNYSKARNVLTNEQLNSLSVLSIPAMQAEVYELMK